jgi:nitrosocyanin
VHTFRRFLPAALVGAALLLSGCGGSPESPRRVSVATVGAGAGFDPQEIVVDKDDNVILTAANPSNRVHGFSIEGYGIQEELEPSANRELKFKSSKPGTFKIWCQLHETHQVATLVVR